MALISGFPRLVASSDNFSDWLSKSNEMIDIFRGDVVGQHRALTALDSDWANTDGNAKLNGGFQSNLMIIVDELRGGTNAASNTLLVSSNTFFQNTSDIVLVDSTTKLEVTNNTEIHEHLTVSDTGGYAYFHGNTHVEERFEVGSQTTGAVRNTTVDSLIITGANIEFYDYSANTTASIRTNDNGSLTVDADRTDTGVAETDVTFNVDAIRRLQLNSANIDMYEATGVTTKLRWQGAHDTNEGSLTIRKLGAEANTALDVDGTARVDELIVDGGVTSNVWIGNTDFTTTAAAHSHYLNIRKSEGQDSGIYFRTTDDGTPGSSHKDTALHVTSDEALHIATDHMGRSLPNAHIILSTNGHTTREIWYANGVVAFTDPSGTDQVEWDPNVGTDGHLRFLNETRATFGDGEDLQIFYDIANATSYILDTGSGPVRIQASDMFLQTSDGTSTANASAPSYISMYDGANVELHYADATNEVKLATQSYGIWTPDSSDANTYNVRVRNNLYLDSASAALSNVISWESGANVFNFNDDIKLTFGDNDEFKIWYDGTSNNSYITENGTGDLIVQANNMQLEDTIGQAYFCGTAGLGASVHYNGVQKLITTNIGIEANGLTDTDTLLVSSTSHFQGDIGIEGSTGANTLTWDVSANTLNLDDDNYITLGTGADFTMHHEGSNTYLTESGGGELHIQANNLILEDTAGNDYLCANAGGSVSLHFSGASKIETTTNGIEVTGLTDTDTLLVSSTSTFQGDIGIEGSTGANTLTWDVSANTLNLDDNNYITWGTGGDFSVHFDGTDGYVTQASGEMYLEADEFCIRSAANSEQYITAIKDGAVELYYDNVKKFETTATGITVTGTVVADGVTVGDNEIIQLGTTMQIYNDGANSYITESGSGDFVLQANNIQLENTDGDAYFCGIAGQGASLHYNSVQKLITTTDGVTVTGNVVSDGFVAGDGEKLWLGDSQDLQIWHAAAGNSYIKETGGGDLVLQANSLSLETTAGESYFNGTADGAAIVYYNGLNRVETTNTGATITGTLIVDGVTVGDDEIIQLGTTMQIYNDGANSYIKESGSGDLVLQANNMQLENTDGQAYFCGTAGLGASVHYNGDQKLITTANGIEVTGLTDTDTLLVSSTSNFQDDLGIWGSTGANTVTWDKSANTLNFDDNNYITLGTGADFTMYHEGSNTYLTESGAGDLIVMANNMQIQDTTGQAYFCGFSGLGASMHYNGDQKIITTATGVDVTGNVVSDGLNVDGNAYVSTNTHLGGTSDATHTLQVTGDAKISSTLEVTSNISTNGNVLPLTEFNDLGSLTARWDAFLGDVEIGDTKNILPEVDQTSDIGSATLRFNMFAWNSNVYNDLTVDGNLEVGADLTVVAGDVTVNGSITVENDSTFNSNVVFTNIQVDGTANIQLLEVESIVANNVALIGNGAIDVATNAITVVDSFAKTDSRGLKYMIQGTNDDGLSAFAIEIMVAHNDASVFFTRYAEVSNNFDAVIVPQINGANVELTVQCASGSVSNVHSFNVVRLEAR